jgi:hypothetical protein
VPEEQRQDSREGEEDRACSGVMRSFINISPVTSWWAVKSVAPLANGEPISAVAVSLPSVNAKAFSSAIQ